MPISFGLLWILLGVLFLFLEFVCPGFVIFFFGLAALITAGFCYLIPGLSIAWQVGIFIFASITTLFVGRAIFKQTFKGRQETLTNNADDPEFTGRIVLVTQRITPEIAGRIEVNGSTWTATAETTLEVGEKAVILGRKNITFSVQKINA
ncbi:MAG: NfeD family protein [bacterium]|nr:NfeD family protein [bacterium]MDO5462033.1 NfeD family protein [bacterium]